MKMCRDGRLCEQWFGADGSLICRHGLVAEPSWGTAVDSNCPADLLHKYELEKWAKFWKVKDQIITETE